MPPNIKSTPLSLSVTLTPLHNSGDTRTLTLNPGEPCPIGRASKSKLKNLQARPNNALFDCPVISREHAELRAHLWDRPENQVTIIDRGSMHGTRVNGTRLPDGQSKPLRSGDIIQFGEKVARGASLFDSINSMINKADRDIPDSHDGVFVTFDKRENFSQQSQTLTASNTNRGYSYPYTSDEESDYGNDDHISVIDNEDEVMEVSSAKTTPEQAKAQLGTQEQPIDLDRPARAEPALMQDSVDTQASVIVPESLPVVTRKAAYEGVVYRDGRDQDEVIERAVATHVPKDSQIASSDPMDDDVRYANNDETEEAGNDFDSEASELSHWSDKYSGVGPSDGEDDGRHESLRSVSPDATKDASPELRSSGQANNTARPVASTYQSSQPTMAFANTTDTHLYDPVHGAQDYPLSERPWYAPTFPSTYPPEDTYRPVSFTSSTSLDQTTRQYPVYPAYNGGWNAEGSSRWDQMPTLTRQEPTVKISEDLYFSGRGAFSPQALSRFVPHSRTSQPINFNNSFTGFSANKYSQHSLDSLPTSRISIPDIVENEKGPGRQDQEMCALYPADRKKQEARVATSLPDASVEPGMNLGNAKATNNEGTEDDPVMHSRSPGAKISLSRKRKAEEITSPLPDAQKMSDEMTVQLIKQGIRLGPSEIEQVALNINSLNNEAASSRRPGSEQALPPSKRFKISNDAFTERPSGLNSASSIAASVAKYAAVASAGGAGMLAFLCSPASEKLLTWLS